MEEDPTAELRRAWNSAVADLEQDLNDACEGAAASGVAAAQAEHPYTDRTRNLTDTAKPVRTAKRTSMVWPAKYAGFVNEGTSRSAAYPFTPLAVATAEAELEQAADIAVDKFVSRLNGA